MANKQLASLDFNNIPVKNLVLESLATAPSNPLIGKTYVNNVSKKFFYHDGTSFIDPTARANHTGTQLAATISDFAATAKAIPLNQFAVPTGSVAFNTQKITGVNTIAANGATLGTTAITGLTVYNSFSHSNGPSGFSTGTSTFTNNDVRLEGTSSLIIFGTGNLVMNSGSITAGAGGIIINSTGLLDLSTGTGAVKLNATGGLNANSGKITNLAAPSAANDGVRLTDLQTIAVRKYAATIGNGSLLSFTITHNLNLSDYTVSLRDITTKKLINNTDVEYVDANNIKINFTVAPALNNIRVVVHA